VPFICLLVDVCVGGENAVEVIEAALIDRRGVVDQQLLDFQPVRDLFQAHNMARLNTIGRLGQAQRP
jgi:hypothetical protein